MRLSPAPSVAQLGPLILSMASPTDEGHASLASRLAHSCSALVRKAGTGDGSGGRRLHISALCNNPIPTAVDCCIRITRGSRTTVLGREESSSSKSGFERCPETASPCPCSSVPSDPRRDPSPGMLEEPSGRPARARISFPEVIPRRRASCRPELRPGRQNGT
ncbi:hypothetical protein THAOC_33390 [Thalassiosira oceanica]|uniref:Uncharacterized protein n=1 Tax=Thalassiosira oceanica TaxID=159749 RepID=K0R747_THAOC|nr:hypothetical protein THAOC_33390 [Thalassiosira oceanica]|eukprot:EJK47864.1 hypothetical protein THAOC_33390 [Thalassiosira oceanica]